MVVLGHISAVCVCVSLWNLFSAVCSNSSENQMKPLCAAGVWLTPLLQAVYLFVQYILMVNLLIAFFKYDHLCTLSLISLFSDIQKYNTFKEIFLQRTILFKVMYR